MGRRIAAQSTPTGVNRADGELSSTVAGNGSGAVNVDVAVVDTGIAAHPDLTIAGGVNCSTGTSYSDGNGHGTHVAGTIGAKDDANGVAGVASGARLRAVRVLNDQGSGSWSSVICGIDWVTARAGTIEVANMSLGGTGGEGSCADGGMRQAICRSVGAGARRRVRPPPRLGSTWCTGRSRISPPSSPTRTRRAPRTPWTPSAVAGTSSARRSGTR